MEDMRLIKNGASKMVGDCSSSVPSSIIKEVIMTTLLFLTIIKVLANFLILSDEKRGELMKFGCHRLIQQSDVKVTFVRCKTRF